MANTNIVFIDPDVCEKCMICVEVFACPAIQRGADKLVPWIHGELCNGNGSCIQVCPLGAIKRVGQSRFGGPTAVGQDSAPVRPPATASPGQAGTPVPPSAPAAFDPGADYSGGQLVGSKTDFAGPDSEVCRK